MSEQIYVNGNTYTLGATASPRGNSGSTGSFFVGNLLPGFTYDLLVTAYNFAGFSGVAGPIQFFVPEGFYPNPPDQFSVINTSLNTVILSFRDRSLKETGFKIYVRGE